jgi:hypothetical protein
MVFWRPDLGVFNAYLSRPADATSPDFPPVNGGPFNLLTSGVGRDDVAKLVRARGGRGVGGRERSFTGRDDDDDRGGSGRSARAGAARGPPSPVRPPLVRPLLLPSSFEPLPFEQRFPA